MQSRPSKVAKLEDKLIEIGSKLIDFVIQLLSNFQNRVFMIQEVFSESLIKIAQLIIIPPIQMGAISDLN